MTLAAAPLARRVAFVAAALAAAAHPVALAAQAPCVDSSSLVFAPAGSWSGPLGRVISVDARDGTLANALDRVARAAGIRLSYSAESFDTARRACIDVTDTRLGDALRQLLRGEPVEVVAAGDEHVVLTPLRIAAAEARTVAVAVIPLEPIVVTGTASVPARHVPYTRTVIDASRLSAETSPDFSRMLSSAVPGLWTWVSSPASLGTRYGSVRGASSFGATYPKVYLDGIEVANPLVLSRFTPEAIGRIDVIRGPQGSAMYGTDAISGVVNIVTRHDPSENGAPSLQLRTGAGFVSSAFSRGSVLSQDHVLTARAGSVGRSVRLNLATGSTGEFVPDARSRYFALNGSARALAPDRVMTGTVRFNIARAGSGTSPLLENVSVAPGGLGASSLSPRSSVTSRSSAQYTLGSSLSFTPSPRATHDLVIGVDGYRLSGPLGDGLPGETPAAADYLGGGADRLSVRASTEWRAIVNGRGTGSVTFGAEQSILRETAPRPRDAESAPVVNAGSEDVRMRSGLFATANVSFADLLYLTAGLRLEADDAFGPGRGFQRLPMAGATLVRDWGRVTGKLRTAYGRGVRPAETALRESYGPGLTLSDAAVALPPEEQTGLEIGADLVFAERFAIGITRFDQSATNLVQAVANTPNPSPRLAWNSEVAYRLHNVGGIENKGWEAEGSASFGRISLTGHFSAVDSRVRQLAAGYAGDLRLGDRILAVPARTAGVTGNWTADRWSFSLNAYRAWSWINYDRERMLTDLAAAGAEVDSLTGDQLRDYWREYDGVPRLDASANFDLRPGLSLLFSADNLFDRQLGEPDNVTVVPGRTLSVGIRARL